MWSYFIEYQFFEFSFILLFSYLLLSTLNQLEKYAYFNFSNTFCKTHQSIPILTSNIFFITV